MISVFVTVVYVCLWLALIKLCVCDKEMSPVHSVWNQMRDGKWERLFLYFSALRSYAVRQPSPRGPRSLTGTLLPWCPAAQTQLTVHPSATSLPHGRSQAPWLGRAFSSWPGWWCLWANHVQSWPLAVPGRSEVAGKGTGFLAVIRGKRVRDGMLSSSNPTEAASWGLLGKRGQLETKGEEERSRNGHRTHSRGLASPILHPV